jgi:hypothetical protein
MRDFATVANIIGTFPSVSAKNASGAGVTDGTALVADWVNNIWGAFQDLLQRAGLTPSGVVEAYAAETGTLPLGTTTSQLRTAMQMAFGSPGELVLWCRSQAPAMVGARILLLQGQTIAIPSYKDLVAATYCGDGVNNTVGVPFYKSSDSGGVTRATAGTYFTLPDARGVTLRGVDTGATKDPQGATRGGGTPNGSLQADAFQGHKHGERYTGNNSQEGAGFVSHLVSDGDTATGVNTTTPVDDGSSGTPRTSTETRMYNLACYIGIRY